MNDEKLLDAKQLGAMLGLSRRTLTRYEEAGMLHPVKLNKRVIRYRLADVDAMLEKFQGGRAA
jgi:predicted DNA-binding transcriptional regulator AlpA